MAAGVVQLKAMPLLKQSRCFGGGGYAKTGCFGISAAESVSKHRRLMLKWSRLIAVSVRKGSPRSFYKLVIVSMPQHRVVLTIEMSEVRSSGLWHYGNGAAKTCI